MIKPRRAHGLALALALLLAAPIAAPIPAVRGQDGETPPPDARRITGTVVDVSFVLPVGYSARPPLRESPVSETIACVGPDERRISVELTARLDLTQTATESFRRRQHRRLLLDVVRTGRRPQLQDEPKILVGRWSKGGVGGAEARIQIPFRESGARGMLFSILRSGPGGRGLIVTAWVSEHDDETLALMQSLVESAEFPRAPVERFVGRSVPISFQPPVAGVELFGEIEGSTETLTCPAPGEGAIVVCLSREQALKPAGIRFFIRSQKHGFASASENQGETVEWLGEPRIETSSWAGGDQVEITMRFRSSQGTEDLFSFGRTGPGRLGIVATARIATSDQEIREDVRTIVRSAIFPEVAVESPAAAAAGGGAVTLVGQRIPVRVKLPAGWSARAMDEPTDVLESYRIDEPVGRGVLLQFSRRPGVMDRRAVEDFVREVRVSILRRHKDSGTVVTLGETDIRLEPRGKGVWFEAGVPVMLEGRPLFVLVVIGICDENGTVVMAAGRDDEQTPVILRRLVRRANIPWLPKALSERQRTEKTLKGLALRLAFMLTLASFGAVIGGWIPAHRWRLFGASLGGAFGLVAYLGLVVVGEAVAGEPLFARPKGGTIFFELGFATPCGMFNGLLFLIGVGVLMFTDAPEPEGESAGDDARLEVDG